MKNMKCCVLFMMIGAGMALTYKKYESEIKCACKKMKEKELNMIKDGLDIE